MKTAFQTIYGISMIILFTIMCGFAESEKFGPAIICFAVLTIMVLPLNKMFPENEKKEGIK